MKVVLGSIILLANLSVLACSPQPESEQLPISQLSVASECDPLKACRASGASMSMNIVFTETPRALQPFLVVIKSEDEIDIKSISINFSMRDMTMGLNRYALVRTSEGEWQADVTLPICISGRTDWVAAFDIRLPDQVLVYSLPFVLEK